MSIDYNIYFGPVIEVDQSAQHYAIRQLNDFIQDSFFYKELRDKAYFLINKKDPIHRFIDAKYETEDYDIEEKFYLEMLETFEDLYREKLEHIRFWCPEATVKIKLLVYQS
jgi:hypothetical protein